VCPERLDVGRGTDDSYPVFLQDRYLFGVLGADTIVMGIQSPNDRVPRHLTPRELDDFGEEMTGINKREKGVHDGEGPGTLVIVLVAEGVDGNVQPRQAGGSAEVVEVGVAEDSEGGGAKAGVINLHPA